MQLRRIETKTGPLFVNPEKVALIGRADIGTSVIFLEGCAPATVPLDPEALAAQIEGREPPPAASAEKTTKSGLHLAA